MILTESEKSYLAGIVDGEGCFQVEKHAGYYGTVRLTITNTSESLMEWLQLRLGGYVSFRPYTHRKPVYVWETRGKNCVDVVQAIQPFLIIKCQQAKILLDAYNNVQLYRSKKVCQKLTSEHLASRVAFYNAMHEANA